MLWGGRWEGGSCLGTHVRIKDFKIKKKKFKIKKKIKCKPGLNISFNNFQNKIIFNIIPHIFDIIKNQDLVLLPSY